MVRRTFSLTFIFLRALLWTAVFWFVVVQLSWLWLNQAPASVQKWLDLVSGQRFRVEHIQISPSLLMPQVQLENLQWRDKGVQLDIQRVSFDLSWLKNLSESGIWGQTLLVEGLRLRVPEAGISENRGPPPLQALEAWLQPHRYQLWLPFRRALIRDAHIDYGEWEVDVPELLLEKRRVYRLRGEARIAYQNRSLWHLAISGLLRADWLGRLHSGWLQAHSIKSAPLAHLAPLFETRWKNGELNFDFYLTLDEGAPSALLKVNLDNLQMMGRKGRINSVGATLFWRDGRNEQRFSIEQWLLNGRALKNLSPAYVVWRKGTLKVSIEALSLEPFRIALAALWPQWDWNHTHIALSGLEAIFDVRPFQLAVLSGKIQKLEWPQVGQVPGVRLMDVTLKGGAAHLDLEFAKPLSITWDAWRQATHRVALPEGLHWRGSLLSGQLQPVKILIDGEVPGQLNMRVQQGRAEISARVVPETLQRLKRFLPYGLMDDELQAWLSKGLVSGAVSPVHLTAKGRVDDPQSFIKDNLVVETQVRSAVLRFRPDWPALEQLDAVVRFTPWTLQIEADRGTLRGVQLDGAKVLIGPLDQPDIALKLYGKAHAEAQAVQALLVDSPLARALGIEKLLGKKITLEQGRINGQVALWIPLYGHEKRVENVDVQVALDGVAVRLWGHERIDRLNGKLHITQQSALAGKIVGRFHQAPLVLKIRTDVHDPALLLNMQGSVDLARLLAKAKGRGQARVAVRIPFERTAPLKFSGVLLPQLKENHLPAPLDKVVASPVHYEGVVHKDAVRLHARWEEALWASARMDLEGHLRQLTVILGEKPAVAQALLKREDESMLFLLNADRVFITKWQAWWAEQKKLLPRLRSEGERLSLPLVLGARMARVQYHAQVFRHVLFTANSLDRDRIAFSMEADKIKGTGIAMPDQRQLAISVNRLVWDAEPQQAQCHLQARPQDLRLFFVGENIRFRQYHFEQVRFNLHSDPAQVRMEGLALKARGGRLQGQGRLLWQYRQNKSRLDLDLYARPVETFLDWADFKNSGFSGEKAHVQAHLSWHGSPDCFDLKALEGRARVRFDDGVIKQAKLGLAKVIGLLSVDSLLRNLKVTLNQLQYNGLVYDYIDARLKMKRGIAAIEQFELEAPSIHATLKGQVDYIRRRYNLKASVAPKVAGTLTTLATIVGLANPLTAISTYLLLKNVPGLENSLVNYHYIITGPWDKPNIVNLETGKPILPDQSSAAGSGTKETVEEFLDLP